MHRHFARRKQVQQTTSPVTFKVTVPLWFLCPSGPSRVHLYVPELQLVVFRIFREYSPSLGASKGPSCSIWWWFCTSILSSPFSVSCSKKESLNHTLLTDPQALSLHTNVLPLVFTKPTSTDVWKQFIVWMCDLWGPGGGGINDNSLRLCLFWNYIRTVFYDPSYPILYPTWKRECCYWRWWCVDHDDLMKWVNHFESNFVAGCSILNVLLCSSATNSPTDWLLFLYPSLRFGNIPKSVKTIARQWSDLGCSPKTAYLCGHPRHYRRYHTYSTKVERQVTIVPCGDSVSDHLVI